MANEQSPLVSASCRFDKLELLHPIMRMPVYDLMTELAKYRKQVPTTVEFRVYETWRSPTRQTELYRQDRSKAKGWQSWHCFGLACDIVPFGGGGWTWDVDAQDWWVLKSLAKRVGLDVPISWDKAHVQHPVCDRMAIRTMDDA